MDLVVPLKADNHNEELRYMLRSAAMNLPHDNLVTVGFRPSWVKSAVHIGFSQGNNKYKNTTQAMRAVCESSEVSEDFIYINDDMFTLHALIEVPKLNRGPLDEIIDLYKPKGGRYYAKGMEQTRDLLIELGCRVDPFLSYELHIPMIINKEKMLEVLNLAAPYNLDCLHKRTLYGNMIQYGGESIADVKVYDGNQDWRVDMPFLSTSDDSFAKYPVGEWIRNRYPLPSPYEYTGSTQPKYRALLGRGHNGRPVTGNGKQA